MIPKTQDAITCRLKRLCPHAILLSEILMLAAVYFYDDLFFKTNEVKNIILEWMLPAKFQA